MIGERFREMPVLSSRLLLVAWVVSCVIMYGAPVFSDSINSAFMRHNRSYGNLTPLCTVSIYTPGLKCRNGDDLIELALAENRTMICGCQQGLIGEGICNFIPGGFSFSCFLSSAPYNGLVYALNSISFMGWFWHQEYIDLTYKPNPWLSQICYWSIVISWVGYGVLGCLSGCLFGPVHTFSTMQVLVPAVSVHWTAVGVIIAKGKGGRKNALVMFSFVLMIWAGNLLRMISEKLPCSDSHFLCTYGFFLGEVFSFSVVLGAPPFISYILGIPLPISLETKEKLLRERLWRPQDIQSLS